MSSTAKVSISVADPELLKWAKQRSKHTGMSLSALFTEAMRLERQMEARKAFLDAEDHEGRATPEEMAAIRAEWGESVEHPRRRTLGKARVPLAASRPVKRKR